MLSLPTSRLALGRVRLSGERAVGFVAAAVLAVGLTLPMTSAGAQPPPDAKSPVNLLVQSAASGSLTSVAGSSDSFELTLRGLNKSARTTAGSGHPAAAIPQQAAVQIETADAAAHPLNSVLTVPGAPKNEDAVALTLSPPTYDQKSATLTFQATPLADVSGTNLSKFKSELDRSVPPGFSKADLSVAPNGWPGCNIAIHFRVTGFPEKLVFTRSQDVVGDLWFGRPKQGEVYEPAASDARVHIEFVGKTQHGTLWCRMGLLWNARPSQAGVFIYFNNYVNKSSDWGCTVPAGWKCLYDGNEHGQPLKLDVTVTK
jgi:hypothetical protein